MAHHALPSQDQQRVAAVAPCGFQPQPGPVPCDHPFTDLPPQSHFPLIQGLLVCSCHGLLRSLVKSTDLVLEPKFSVRKIRNRITKNPHYFEVRFCPWTPEGSVDSRLTRTFAQLAILGACYTQSERTLDAEFPTHPLCSSSPAF